MEESGMDDGGDEWEEREWRGKEGLEEGEDQGAKKTAGGKQQDEHKTKTTMNILVTSGPGSVKIGCEQHGGDLAHLVGPVSVDATRNVLAARCLSQCRRCCLPLVVFLFYFCFGFCGDCAGVPTPLRHFVNLLDSRRRTCAGA